jgi:hypothetical protein
MGKKAVVLLRFWNCTGKTHPLENPDGHDFSEDGTKAVSFEELMYEVSEKLMSFHNPFRFPFSGLPYLSGSVFFSYPL